MAHRADDDVEIELKLELTLHEADVLERSDMFGSARSSVLQEAIYFDTDKHDLKNAGLSLRIRLSGDKRKQTVKAGGVKSSMFMRKEWEFDVADDQPVLDDSTPVRSVLGNRIDGIAPLFRVENERHLWDRDGMEIALDRGRIVAGERESPFCEVELEAKGADPSSLFILARRISEIVPVHLGVLSKGERGYRLLGPTPARTKAEPVELEASMTAAAGFKTIAYACVRHLQLNVPLVLDKRDARALHQARVALRRLRSALSIYKAMLTDGRVEHFNQELRWLAGELGKARDLDVLIARADDGPLKDDLLAAQDHAYADAINALQSDRERHLILDFVEWVEVGEWQNRSDSECIRTADIRCFANSALDKLRRRVKKRGRDLTNKDDDARHDLRKAAKKLRYATEFFAAIYDKKTERHRHKEFVSRLEKLQDRLGKLNDLAHTGEVLNRSGLAAAPNAAELIDARQREKLIAGAAKDYVALMDSQRFWR